VAKKMSVKHFVFGGIASLTAEMGTFPLDTTKTRLQVQGQQRDAVCRESRYRGMTHALLRIAREEGVRALYGGIAPALLRQASYGTVKIGLYHYLKKINPAEETVLMNVLAGMTSGAIASAIANPTDVLKVRMQSASDAAYSQRKSCAKYFQQIYREEGVHGLYRGVVPTANRAMVVAGVLLPSYDFFKDQFLRSGYMSDTTFTHLCASFLAGLMGTAASNPIDVIKSRMMNQRVNLGNTQVHIYANSLDCLLITLRTEGPAALYRGFIPAYLRLGPWNIIFFVTYEKLKRVF
jgi:solute carrier family 25 protein 14/30